MTQTSIQKAVKVGDSVKIQGRKNPLTVTYVGKCTATAAGPGGGEFGLVVNQNSGILYANNYREAFLKVEVL